MIGPLRLSARERKWEGGVSGRMFVWEPGTEPLGMHKVGIFVSLEGRYGVTQRPAHTFSLLSWLCNWLKSSVNDAGRWKQITHWWFTQPLPAQYGQKLQLLDYSLSNAASLRGMNQSIPLAHMEHSVLRSKDQQQQELFCGTCGGLAVGALYQCSWAAVEAGSAQMLICLRETLTQDWHLMGLQIDGFWIQTLLFPGLENTSLWSLLGSLDSLCPNLLPISSSLKVALSPAFPISVGDRIPQHPSQRLREEPGGLHILMQGSPTADSNHKVGYIVCPPSEEHLGHPWKPPSCPWPLAPVTSTCLWAVLSGSQRFSALICVFLRGAVCGL